MMNLLLVVLLCLAVRLTLCLNLPVFPGYFTISSVGRVLGVLVKLGNSQTVSRMHSISST